MEIVNIDPEAIAAQATPARSGPTLEALVADARFDTIGPGDVLSVQIYEIGVSLFGRTIAAPPTPEGLSPPPTATGQQIGAGFAVGEDGTITLPYIGRIHVAGLTPLQVQDAIVRGLRGKSQSPQAVVTVQQNWTNTALMMGAVPRPGRVGLNATRVRLLDAIVDVGGAPAQDSIVRFTRQGRTVEQPLDQIDLTSADNLVILPGDRIEIIRQPRTFLVFGANDRIAQVPFDVRNLSLAEALARIGGPSDGRADPRSVFVFRYADGAPVPGVAGPPQKPVVYQLNMMQASSYFLAQKFAMRDKDIIYVANSQTNQLAKAAQIFNLLASPVYLIRALTQ
jgi:polysaccharide export outer membrane protein